MSVELVIPAVGESITEALISRWLIEEGESVGRDQPVVELETDKVTVELPAPVAGKLTTIKMAAGETAKVGDVIGLMEEGEVEEASSEKTTPKKGKAKKSEAEPSAESKAASGDREPSRGKKSEKETKARDRRPRGKATAPDLPRVMPAAMRLLEEHGLEPSEVSASGPGGRLLKEDVERHVASAADGGASSKELPAAGDRPEELVPMSPIRKRIAQRLVEAQQTAALLTTFNEIDMTAVKQMRSSYREGFEKRHGIKLGFMSFFVKACVDALGAFPRINAEIVGSDVLYRNYFDIGIAVSTDRGLMVPVIRNAEGASFSEIEKTIADFGGRARQGKIKLEELEGGTFTITNGGIFGSMLSTPIVNPPQSGVLGLHAIQERPIAVDGEVVVRPMMYVALTYDHRIVDGREAVSFLVRIKQTIEDPSRILLEV